MMVKKETKMTEEINMEKKWKTKVGEKIIKHGAKGYRIGKVGSDKWKSYCARSLGIAEKYPKARLKESPNYQSRRKWKCPIRKIEGGDK